MIDEAAMFDWSGTLRRRAHLLHQQIASVQRLVRESGGNDDMVDMSCASYYAMLDELYEKDVPVARVLDRSDLFLHLEGEGLQTRTPRLSLVTGIMGDVRKQINTMIKTLVSSFSEGVELPREIELRLNSLVPGSLYLGFSLPAPDPGFVELEQDPVFGAARQALEVLGSVTASIDKPNAYEVIQRDFADPKLRDAALSAVGQLAPSGRRGVSSVAIGGRALKHRAWRTLTPQTRQQVRAWLERPMLGEGVVEFTGRVRAIDLDLRRFDLRRVDLGHQPDLRCIYPAMFDIPAKRWLDRVVTVRGPVETYQGSARLLQVENVEEQPDGSAG